MKRTLILFTLLLTITLSVMAQQDETSEQDVQLHNTLWSFVHQGSIDSLKQMVADQHIDLKQFDSQPDKYTSLLVAAAWNGQTEMTKYLIKIGLDPKSSNSNGNSPLHSAAWRGHLDIVKLLVEAGADVNQMYLANGGLTPLSCAAESGNIDIVRYLISQGADPTNTTSSGGSPIRSAAYSGYYDIFVLLADLQPKDYNWQEALFYAIIGGNPDIVRYVVETKKAKVNVKSSIWSQYAIEKAVHDRFTNKRDRPDISSVAVVKYLLSQGAKISDINGGDLYSFIQEYSSSQMKAFLIEQGVNINVPEYADDTHFKEWTPLAITLDKSDFVLAQYIFNKGIKNDQVRGEPLVLFFADGFYNSPQIIDFLVKNKINTPYYDQALARCVANNDSTSLEILLQAGADIHQLSPDGSNLLNLAGSTYMANILIDKGVDTNNQAMLDKASENIGLLLALDEKGIYPPIEQDVMNQILHQSAISGDTVTIKYILRRGADIQSRLYPLGYNDRWNQETLKKLLRSEYSDKINNLLDIQNVERNILGMDISDRTSLMMTAIQGYGYCNYGDYQDRSSKVQVSPEPARILLDAGANVNATDSLGKTALHYASSFQYCRMFVGPIPMGSRYDQSMGAHGDPAPPPLQYHDEIGKLLIERGANINLQDSLGNTPLMLAAIAGNDGMLRMLLDNKANVSVRNRWGATVFDCLIDYSALQVFVDAGYRDSIPQEVINDSFYNQFIQSYYSSRWDYQAIKNLVDMGADVTGRLSAPYDDYTPFCFLFKENYGTRFDIAQLLVDHGVDLNQLRYNGSTYLIDIVDSSNLDDHNWGNNYAENAMQKLEFLLNNGADVNQPNSTSFTPLTIARCEGKTKLAEYLESKGAVRDINNEWWYTIHESYYESDIKDRLQSLMDEGVDVNLKTDRVVSKYSPDIAQKGVTALMIAVARGTDRIVQVMLDLGADVNIKAENGVTALSIAKDKLSSYNTEIIEMLKKSGAK